MKKFKTFIKNYETKIILLDFLKWKFIDIYRAIRYKKPIHLYGVRCITGMYGCGKTMTMSKLALDYRKKYGDSIYICSNFGFALQDFEFNNVKQLIKQYDKPIIFLWDEVQNEFPSTDKNFPKEVRKALSFCRKGNGKMFYWASQDHELVHKTIRRLTIAYGCVKTLGGRLTKVKWYYPYDYQNLFEQNNIDKKIKIHPFKRQSFIQTDYIRNLYDSYAWDNGEKLQDE